MNLAQRLKQFPWDEIETSLWTRGYAQAGSLLTPEECAELTALYPRDELFRSRIDMARYRFGEGDYKYFNYPLPAAIEQLREHAYPPLAAIANRWVEALGVAERYPADLGALLKQCHEAGQTKPTPLLLHYETGGYNCLHQDLYGDVAFPLQVVCFLSRPGRDYTGGEFIVLEQRPRAQSAAEATLPDQGEMIVFTTRYRPVKGSRGYYRVNVKHGVSRVRSGARYTLGVIFHDAK
jgi:hypothetical protein